ncbi:hypothetical protein VTN77DRAFT_9507 [Rasamsonia byssochlamydoides]|uniref:uncharacterized protein n=1 Tax=Rasamsonia byssochlamydoides TaxID=89139 RepID=UPI0037426A0F
MTSLSNDDSGPPRDCSLSGHTVLEKDPVDTPKAISHPSSVKDEKVDDNTEVSPESNNGDKTEEEYPGLFSLIFIIVALILSIFLVSLDMTIVATAIPQITDEFKSLDQVGWYGSAFFLTVASFQSTWGKGYKYFPLKITFLLAIFIFEMGSLICGVAQNSTTLIVGRAIAGAGAAGIASGVYIIIAFSAPPRQRPAYTGILGATYAFASVVGPLLGGVFTSHVSWRWWYVPARRLIVQHSAMLTVILIQFLYQPPNWRLVCCNHLLFLHRPSGRKTSRCQPKGENPADGPSRDVHHHGCRGLLPARAAVGWRHQIMEKLRRDRDAHRIRPLAHSVRFHRVVYGRAGADSISDPQGPECPRVESLCFLRGWAHVCPDLLPAHLLPVDQERFGSRIRHSQYPIDPVRQCPDHHLWWTDHDVRPIRLSDDPRGRDRNDRIGSDLYVRHRHLGRQVDWIPDRGGRRDWPGMPDPNHRKPGHRATFRSCQCLGHHPLPSDHRRCLLGVGCRSCFHEQAGPESPPDGSGGQPGLGPCNRCDGFAQCLHSRTAPRCAGSLYGRAESDVPVVYCSGRRHCACLAVSEMGQLERKGNGGCCLRKKPNPFTSQIMIVYDTSSFRISWRLLHRIEFGMSLE